MKELPVDIQSIRILLGGDYVYVDKTPFIHQLIKHGRHYFLARPRRFGKSLFVSTLQEIFSGNKELFKDCAIYQSDYDWQPYPVILLNFYETDTRNALEFETSLKRYLQDIAQLLGVSITTPTAAEGLKYLILRLYEKYQQPVVVLVDEYDSPIINNLYKPADIEVILYLLRKLFGMLKSLDAYLRFSFTTGVSKFSRASLFTVPNNVSDITMHPKYAAMLGYTQEELHDAFAEHIQAIVQERDMTEEAVKAEIKAWYNGYRFTEADTYVYNPFSTLHYMALKKPKSYWYATGTPALLIKELQKYPAESIPLEDIKASEADLVNNSDVEALELQGLMFQTGYLTIQDYNAFADQYTLGFPNQEVRQAFVNSLVKKFAPHTPKLAPKCAKALTEHALDPFFNALQSSISSFPYWLFSRGPEDAAQESTHRERTYHMMLLSLLKGMDFVVAAEVLTNLGCIDLVLQLPKTTYVIEVKLDRNATVALEQIHMKGYYKAYTNQGKQLALVGVNFSSEERNIDDWQGELRDEQRELIQKLS